MEGTGAFLPSDERVRMSTLLVTGGCGFIGSNFIRHILAADPDVAVVNFDALTYAGNLANLADLDDHPRYRFVKGDITDRDAVRAAFRPGVRHVIHFAAESHVDRSIQDSGPFVRTNVVGTQILLDAAREFAVERYVQVSTDEVYGSLGPTGLFTETTPLAPSSPYSASKAAADLLVRSYAHTFGLPALITRCSNNYGPYQFPEKLIPLFITNLLRDEPVPVYGDGGQVRDWIHVRDHCRAVERVWQAGRVGEVYNIGGRCEKTNLELTHTLLDLLGKPRTPDPPRDRTGSATTAVTPSTAPRSSANSAGGPRPVRAGAARHHRLVSRQRRMGGADPFRRVPRILRAAIRRPGGRVRRPPGASRSPVMQCTPTAIPDVVIIEPRVFQDDRGFFLETYQVRKYAEAGIAAPMVQDNHSGSRGGVLRGLHYQIRCPQGKLVRVMAGEVFDVAVDLRRSSPTFGRWVGVYLSAHNQRQVWVPPGFAHGFYVTSDWAEVTYKVTDY